LPLSDGAVNLAGAKIGRDVSIQFGLTAAPTSFRRLVGNFVKLYLGTEKSPVPFGGRGREIEALNAWLGGHLENSSHTVLSGDPGSNNLLITAPAGRGKTALLVRWIEQCQTDWSVVFVPVSIRAETNQALTFYQALAARLAEILLEPLPEPRADPAAYYKDKVIDYIDRIGRGGQRCLLVIDGLDEARGWKMDTTVLPVEASPSLKVVVSARELAGDWIAPARDDSASFIHAMALALASALLAESEAAKALERALAAVRNVGEPLVRTIGLGILSARLSVEHGARLMKEAVDLARTSRNGLGFTLALLATLGAPEDIQSAMENAGKEVGLTSDENDKEATKSVKLIVSALTTGGTAAEMQAEVTEALKILDDDKETQRWIAALLTLMFSPKLSTGETDELIDEILVAFRETEMGEDRGILLVMIASYLPTPRLWHCFSELLDIAARSPRPGVLAGLAVAQGLVNECFKQNPTLGGNRIPGSPLARLGGTISVSETMEAIRDVCSWWP
jgi:hypothetical protein